MTMWEDVLEKEMEKQVNIIHSNKNKGIPKVNDDVPKEDVERDVELKNNKIERDKVLECMRSNINKEESIDFRVMAFALRNIDNVGNYILHGGI